MFTLLNMKAKMAALGAALLSIAFLFLRLNILKHQRDRSKVVAETLKARLHQETVIKKIKREEEKKLVSRRADLLKELSKEGEDFKGVDNFNQPNDY